MKPKDAGFFQLHVEKLILALAIGFLAAIVLLYFMGNPYAVDLGRDTVSPSDVPIKVREKADQLASRLKDEASEIPEVRIAGYTDNFSQRSERQALEDPNLAMPLGLLGVTGGDIEDILPYDLPTPPLPTEITARAGYGVFDRAALSMNDGALKPFVLNDLTKDMRYVSVGATFDLDAWDGRLEAPADNPVPRNWWQSLHEVAGVYLQRQELDPLTDQWGNTTYIDVLPNQVAYLPPDDDASLPEMTQGQAEDAVRQIKTGQEQIVRPEFPKLGERSVWLPPDAKVRNLSPEEYDQLSKLRRRIKTLEKQIEIAQQNLQRMQDRDRREAERGRQEPRRQAPSRRQTPARGGSPAGGGYGGAYPGGGPAATGRNTGRTQRGAANSGNDQQQLQERLRSLHEDLIEQEIARDEMLGIETDFVKQRNRNSPYGPGGPGGYGEFPGGYPGGGYPGGGYPGGGYTGGKDPYGAYPGGGYGVDDPRDMRRQDGDTLIEEVDEHGRRTIKVWAHDLSVAPGKTYRYRVIVTVLNPLFRQTRVHPEQKKQHYHRLVLGPGAEELDAADWSEPVTVDPEHHFFIVGGNPQQGVGRVEVWRIFNGAWQHHEFIVQPGDPIGGDMEIDFNGAPMQLDMRVDTIVVDLADTRGPTGGRDVGIFYLEPDSDRLAFRTVAQDADSPVRKRLQNESEIYRQLGLQEEPLAAQKQ